MLRACPMAKAKEIDAAIVGAARALEQEVAGLEALSRSAQKIRLTSEKNITRAATELQRVLELPERMNERLQGVAAAMTRMQERQQAALAPLAALAAEIQQRTQKLQGHMQTFGALGQAAGEVNAELAAHAGDTAALARAEARLQEISAAARDLFEAARADDFPDIAREADVLKQRMATLGKRLGEKS
jgi:chromosome segregation ATPase